MITTWNKATAEQKSAAIARPPAPSSTENSATIVEIFNTVEKYGDDALLRLTQKYDSVSLDSVTFDVFAAPAPNLAIEDEQAILNAIANIKAFHKTQYPTNTVLETQTGVRCEKTWRALERVGLYVPGGTAPLISTFLMLAVPAIVAGVKEITIVTPPQNNGSLVNDGILFIARLLDIKTLYLVGGAQAIAALTFGTQTIPRVDKIFGPGNMWVTEAKTYATTLPAGPAIDMPAGPSEVMVIADNTANPAIVAADLLAQAEHDTMAQAILVCFSSSFADEVSAEISLQLQSLPRSDIAQEAIKNMQIIICKNQNEALEVVNSYAPEHLIINTKNADDYVAGVNNAGSVFVGEYTPEAVGDYASGTNHVLPTAGYARSYSGLSTQSFMRSMSVQKLDKTGLLNLGPTVVRLANMEGLAGHALSVSKRLDIIEKDNENEL